jgi:hypothetical protein
MQGGGLPALLVPNKTSQQQPSSASTQPNTDSKIKSYSQHPNHHSIGAASVLSPKGSMNNQGNLMAINKDQNNKRID